jgi:AraC family transcriptional regulator
MQLQKHGVRKFPTTSPLLASAAGLGWSTISAELRLENAMTALAARKLPLAQIALNAQFSSQASFTRAFHRATGVTPKEYQRRRL